MNANNHNFIDFEQKKNDSISSGNKNSNESKINNQFNRITSLDDKFVIPFVNDEEIVHENSGNDLGDQVQRSDESLNRNHPFVANIYQAQNCKMKSVEQSEGN
jgi:hypothetical protein